MFVRRFRGVPRPADGYFRISCHGSISWTCRFIGLRYRMYSCRHVYCVYSVYQLLPFHGHTHTSLCRHAIFRELSVARFVFLAARHLV